MYWHLEMSKSLKSLHACFIKHIVTVSSTSLCNFCFFYERVECYLLAINDPYDINSKTLSQIILGLHIYDVCLAH